MIIKGGLPTSTSVRLSQQTKHFLQSIYYHINRPYKNNMRFQILSLLALVGASAANQWAGMENLPDGAYRGFNHPDGSTTMTSLDSGDTYTFSLVKSATGQTKRLDYAISKRDTSCWGYQLDHGGVDDGVKAELGRQRRRGPLFRRYYPLLRVQQQGRLCVLLHQLEAQPGQPRYQRYRLCLAQHGFHLRPVPGRLLLVEWEP
jgi:hypothetical protein